MTLAWLFVTGVPVAELRPIDLRHRSEAIFKHTSLKVPGIQEPAIELKTAKVSISPPTGPVRPVAPAKATAVLQGPLFKRTALSVPGIASSPNSKPADVALSPPTSLPKLPLNMKQGLPVLPLPTLGTANLMPPSVSEVLPAVSLEQGAKPSNETKGASAIPIATGKKLIDDTLCDVICSNTDLNGVLSMLSATTKANLVAVVSSEQKLTLSLRRVKLVEALRYISSVVGMTYLKSGNAFLVGPADKLKEAYPAEWAKAYPAPVTEITQPTETTKPEPEPEPNFTETYRCNYMVADGLKQTLTDLFGQNLKVAVGPPSITPTLGDRDTTGSTGVSQGLIDKEGKPIGRALVLFGPKSVVGEAISVLKSLDLPRSQIAIQVTIHDISDNALKELGVSWSIGGTTIQESDPKNLNFGSFTRTPFNFGATIKALETTDKAKILASPNVTVLDGERAFVLIGNKLTLPKFSGYDANKIPMYDTSEYKVGIYLQVAANVAQDGAITMSIYPQVSTVVKTTEINGASYPDIATREAQTSLRVQSGETILLGGLLRSEELEQLEQVPILSKIPLFGELFTRRKKTKSASQVVISLTPTLIPPTTNESR